MTNNETLMILSVLKAAYPHSYKDMTKKDGEALVMLWQRMFSDESYEEVNAAISALIATRKEGYSPTVGEVKDQLQKLHSVNELDEQQAWALVSKACSNGSYGYKQEFEKLPPDIQRAVGVPEQLREWARMDADTVQSVVASNFMRNYRATKARQKELQKLPSEVKQMIGSVNIKQIGD